jgi:hypothetical protein
MTPRTLNAGLGVDVRIRVSACRRRLRVSRTGYRTSRNVRRNEECTENESQTSPVQVVPGAKSNELIAKEEAEIT